jgi:hypothetical protein
MPDEPSRESGATPQEPQGTSRQPDPATPKPGPTPLVPPDIDPGYDKSGVPTFESVREKIETRYGTALGAADLDAETPEGRSVEEQYEERQRAAAERLEQIRESMRHEQNGDA